MFPLGLFQCLHFNANPGSLFFPSWDASCSSYQARTRFAVVHPAFKKNKQKKNSIGETSLQHPAPSGSLVAVPVSYTGHVLGGNVTDQCLCGTAPSRLWSMVSRGWLCPGSQGRGGERIFLGQQWTGMYTESYCIAFQVFLLQAWFSQCVQATSSGASNS